MTDLLKEFPEADQHALLASRGFGNAFGALWVERDDLDQVAHLLHADAGTRRDATLEEAVRRSPGPADAPGAATPVWLGPHSSGWSVVVNLAPVGGSVGDRALWSQGRRALEVSWLWEIDGLYDLPYFQDGQLLEELPAFWNGHLDEGSVFAPYVSGLDRDYGDDDGEEQLAHAFLTVVGRITGRFLDDAWFRTPGRVYDLLPAD